MDLVVERSNEPPGLTGGICRQCGFVFFPYQSLGCERCGAFGQDLTLRTLAASGRVRSGVIVQMGTAQIDAPYGAIEIELDDGPVVRGLSEGPQIVPIGAAVVGQLDQDSDAEAHLRLWFKRAEAN